MEGVAGVVNSKGCSRMHDGATCGGIRGAKGEGAQVKDSEGAKVVNSLEPQDIKGAASRRSS